MKYTANETRRRPALSALTARIRWVALLAVIGLGVFGCVDRSDYLPDQNDQTDTQGPPPGEQLDTGIDGGDRDPGDTSRRPEDVDTSWGFGDGGALGEPSIEQIVPPSGPVEGGNRVRVVGDNLTPSMTFLIGGEEMPVEVSGGSLIGRVPASSGPGKVGVKVLTGDDTTLSVPKGYEYVPGLDIESVTPKNVPVEGGAEVTIRGEGFAEKVAVSIDGRSASRVNRIDSELLRAVVPPGSAGLADLRVTTPERATVEPEALRYIEPISIDQIRPAAGMPAGGESVDLHIDGLRSAPTVTFGGADATLTDVDLQANQVTVKTPAGGPGLVDVGVQTKRGADLRSDGFLYTDDSVELGAVHPRSGPVSGGTDVTLTGTGLDPSSATVTFGGEPAQISGGGSTYLELQTPNVSSAGPVDVVVASGGSSVGTIPDGFTYYRNLDITDVSPDSGPVSGGESVTLKGEGFQNVQTVEFGGLPASFSVTSDSEMTATTPEHTAGQVDVVVERSEDVTARLENGYRYDAPLEVWGFQPVRGAVAGGTYVEVRGRGFTQDMHVTFDGKEADNVQLVDDNNITLTTPPHEEAEVPVVAKSGDQTIEGPYPYQYFNPTSQGGGASGGEIDGAVNVTVLATNGGPVGGAYVSLSTDADNAYRGVTNQSGQVTLSGPDVMGPQTVTATAPGYTATTVHTVNAENITIYITKLNTPPPEPGEGGGGQADPPPRATIQGVVQMPPKMADPDDKSTGDMAMVRTTADTRYARVPEPGPGSVRFGTGTYTLNSRVGELAVVALCGVHDSDTNDFDPEFIGVARHVKTSDGSTSQVDVNCNIQLDQTLDVKLTNQDFSPDGPNINRATVYWDFGTDGVFESPTRGESAARLIPVARQPALDGRISDATLTVEAGSYTGQSAPFSQSTKKGVATTDFIVSMPPLVEIPRPDSPAPGAMVTDGTIRLQADGPYWPTMWSVYLLDNSGTVVWHHLMPGSETLLQLPEFGTMPDGTAGSEVSPISGGTYYLYIRGIDAPKSVFDNFSYDDLSFSQWQGYSLNQWMIRLPAP